MPCNHSGSIPIELSAINPTPPYHAPDRGERLHPDQHPMHLQYRPGHRHRGIRRHPHRPMDVGDLGWRPAQRHRLDRSARPSPEATADHPGQPATSGAAPQDRWPGTPRGHRVADRRGTPARRAASASGPFMKMRVQDRQPTLQRDTNTPTFDRISRRHHLSRPDGSVAPSTDPWSASSSGRTRRCWSGRCAQGGWRRVVVFTPTGAVAPVITAVRAGATGVLSRPGTAPGHRPPRRDRAAAADPGRLRRGRTVDEAAGGGRWRSGRPGDGRDRRRKLARPQRGRGDRAGADRAPAKPVVTGAVDTAISAEAFNRTGRRVRRRRRTARAPHRPRSTW